MRKISLRKSIRKVMERKRSRFYRLDVEKASGVLFGKEEIPELQNRFFCFLEAVKLEKAHLVTIGRVYAIFVDRVIFDKKYEFIVEDLEDFYNCFTEVSYREVRDSIDNTEALLSKSIFRR